VSPWNRPPRHRSPGGRRSASAAGSDLTLKFSPALENAHTYKLCFGPEVTALEVRGLVGDITGNGFADGGDRTAVIAMWTGAGYSARTDINMDGVTNGGDRSAVVVAWTGPDNCAP
jgi:hypothetical protein